MVLANMCVAGYFTSIRRSMLSQISLSVNVWKSTTYAGDTVRNRAAVGIGSARVTEALARRCCDGERRSCEGRNQVEDVDIHLEYE